MSSKFYHLNGYGLNYKFNEEPEKLKSKTIPGLNAGKSHSKIPWSVIVEMRQCYEVKNMSMAKITYMYNLTSSTTRNILTYITRRNA